MRDRGGVRFLLPLLLLFAAAAGSGTDSGSSTEDPLW
jgi:hypothetical protein